MKPVSHVSRSRRAAFAFVTVGFSMLMMTWFGVKGMVNEAAMSALGGFKEIAIWIGSAYIGGSAIDYSAGMIAKRHGVPSGGAVVENPDGKVSD